MFKNILVALDGSTHSIAALDQSLCMSTQLSAHLAGIHVIDHSLVEGSFLYDISGSLGFSPQWHLTGDMKNMLQARANNLEATFKEKLNHMEVKITSQFYTEEGDVVDVLSNMGNRYDVLLLGRRGLSFDAAPSEPAEHHIAHSLLKKSSIPILFCSYQIGFFKNIIVAFDASPGAFQALKDAARLATSLESKITICYVSDEKSQITPEELILAERYLSTYTDSAVYVHRCGGKIHELSNLSKEIKADLLMVGYHGTSFWKELVVGHTPEILLNWVECPLWVSK